MVIDKCLGVLLSTLTLFSSRRVVRRHDREAYQQQQIATDPLTRAERHLYDQNQSSRMRRRGRSMSPSTNLSFPSNPFTQQPLRSRDSELPRHTPSLRTIDSGLAVSWRVRVAPSIPSSLPSSETFQLESYSGSENCITYTQ